MVVKAQLSRLRRTAWWEFLVRFVFGGLVTVAAGLVARRWGPIVGGLFLAFPGIFPAGVTLVERHEAMRKRKHGLRGSGRGRAVAALVAAGASLGGFGLVAFALAAWKLLPIVPAWAALATAAILWLGVSVAAWVIRSHLRAGATHATARGLAKS